MRGVGDGAAEDLRRLQGPSAAPVTLPGVSAVLAQSPTSVDVGQVNFTMIYASEHESNSDSF